MCGIGRDWRNRTDEDETRCLESISVESYGHFEFFRGSPRPGPGQGPDFAQEYNTAGSPLSLRNP